MYYVYMYIRTHRLVHTYPHNRLGGYFFFFAITNPRKSGPGTGPVNPPTININFHLISCVTATSVHNHPNQHNHITHIRNSPRAENNVRRTACHQFLHSFSPTILRRCVIIQAPVRCPINIKLMRALDPEAHNRQKSRQPTMTVSAEETKHRPSLTHVLSLLRG